MIRVTPRTRISLQMGCAARLALAIATVSVTLTLPIGAVLAGSSNQQRPIGNYTLVADTSMPQQMLRIERQMKKLQDRMQTIQATTNHQERYKILLAHLKDMRETLGMLSGMEVAMATDSEGQKVNSDTSLNRRQAILDQLMRMMQIMLEQFALQQEPGLPN